jgi:hypothetical protein
MPTQNPVQTGLEPEPAPTNLTLQVGGKWLHWTKPWIAYVLVFARVQGQAGPVAAIIARKSHVRIFWAIFMMHAFIIDMKELIWRVTLLQIISTAGSSNNQLN